MLRGFNRKGRGVKIFNVGKWRVGSSPPEVEGWVIILPWAVISFEPTFVPSDDEIFLTIEIPDLQTFESESEGKGVSTNLKYIMSHPLSFNLSFHVNFRLPKEAPADVPWWDNFLKRFVGKHDFPETVTKVWEEKVSPHLLNICNDIKERAVDVVEGALRRADERFRSEGKGKLNASLRVPQTVPLFYTDKEPEMEGSGIVSVFCVGFFIRVDVEFSLEGKGLSSKFRGWVDASSAVYEEMSKLHTVFASLHNELETKILSKGIYRDWMRESLLRVRERIPPSKLGVKGGVPDSEYLDVLSRWFNASTVSVRTIASYWEFRCGEPSFVSWAGKGKVKSPVSEFNFYLNRDLYLREFLPLLKSGDFVQVVRKLLIFLQFPQFIREAEGGDLDEALRAVTPFLAPAINLPAE